MIKLWKLGRLYRNLGWSIESEKNLYTDMNKRIARLENELREAKRENNFLKESW